MKLHLVLLLKSLYTAELPLCMHAKNEVSDNYKDIKVNMNWTGVTLFWVTRYRIHKCIFLCDQVPHFLPHSWFGPIVLLSVHWTNENGWEQFLFNVRLCSNQVSIEVILTQHQKFGRRNEASFPCFQQTLRGAILVFTLYYTKCTVPHFCQFLLDFSSPTGFSHFQQAHCIASFVFFRKEGSFGYEAFSILFRGKS